MASDRVANGGALMRHRMYIFDNAMECLKKTNFTNETCHRRAAPEPLFLSELTLEAPLVLRDNADEPQEPLRG